MGFISANLKKRKSASSSSRGAGENDEKEKENLNLRASPERKTTKRARDEDPIVHEMREYMLKRLREENDGKREGKDEEKGVEDILEWFEGILRAAKNVHIENERLRELLAQKNGGSETDDDEDVPLEANANDEEMQADDARERNDVEAPTERKEDRELSQPSCLWNVIVHSDDIFKTHILPKLRKRDVSHLYDVNSESKALIARCGLLWSVLVNKGDIWEAHIFPKLNGTDIRFLYQTNPEMRALIKRSWYVKLQKKFKAIEMSSISTLEWSFERHRFRSGERVWAKHSLSFCHKLAQTNKLELLKWAHGTKGLSWDVRTIFAAIKQGNVEMLQYCYENGCPTHHTVCRRAAEDGHLECLKYLHEVAREDWEQKGNRGGVAVAAAREGHLHILKYLAEKDYIFTNRTVYSEAAKNGHLECIKFLHEVSKASWDRETGVFAAWKGHLHILKYLFEVGYPHVTARLCAVAANYGHLECLKYLHEVEKSPWDEHTGHSAAKEGQLHILKYLVERKYSEWKGMTCMFAAKHGRLECLKYVREVVKLPWDETVGVEAAEHGHKHILEYLFQSNYPYFTAETCTAAANGDHINCLRYLREVVKAPWDENTGIGAIRGASRRHFSAFNYLVECKFPYFTEKSCLLACKFESGYALRRLHDVLKVPIHYDCVDWVRDQTHSVCRQYLVEKGYL